MTLQFYRRNYIEGLFVSSGIIRNPDYTCEKMIETLRILREDYGFAGYIHAKAIPGADSSLILRLGQLADRMSVNIAVSYTHLDVYKRQGVAMLVDILNPELVVIGSVFERCEEFLAPSMQEILKQECLPLSQKAVKVVPARLGDSIGDYAALGVALLTS